MFRLFLILMSVLPFVFGCSEFDTDPISVVSVSPDDGMIEPLEDIVVEFTDVPENLHVYRVKNAIDPWLSETDLFTVSGRIATIHWPFYEYSNDSFKIIEGEGIHLSWGSREEYTHNLKFSVVADWVDRVVSVTVGNHQSGWELFESLKKSHINGYITLSEGIGTYLGKRDFPMSGAKKSVDVAIVALSDVGFSQPVTIKEIRKRYSELGYRPLTLEEAFELGRQFHNQPSDSDDVFMSAFTVLLSEESMQFIGACVERSNSDFGTLLEYEHGPCENEIGETWNGFIEIINSNDIINLRWQRRGRAVRIHLYPKERLFTPYDAMNSALDIRKRTRSKFACVIEKQHN